jgi:hypothetical protein
MAMLMRILCVLLVLLGVSEAQEKQRTGAEIWSQFETYMLAPIPEQTSEWKQEANNFVISLTLDELLETARAACEDLLSRPGTKSDEERELAGYVVTTEILGTYLVVVVVHGDSDKITRLPTLATKLVEVIGNKQEPLGFRHAAISWLRKYTDRNRAAHVEVKLPPLEKVLVNIMVNQAEKIVLREEAVDALAMLLYRELDRIREADPNVRKAIEERRKHSHNVICIGELIRAGEATLTEDSIKALKPIEARIIANVKHLSRILADKENEPTRLRRIVRNKLEMVRRLAIAGLDDEIERALQQAVDLDGPGSGPAGSRPAMSQPTGSQPAGKR